MVDSILNAAGAAFRTAPPIGDPSYERYCRALAGNLSAQWPAVRKANEQDIAEAQRRGLPAVLVDRLRLGDEHLEQLVAMASDVPAQLAAVTAPAQGTPVQNWGMLRQVPKPLGVALMIYEARPTVTIEGALLFAAVGNAVLLRGGKEIAATNAVLGSVVRTSLESAGLPADLVTVLDDPSRSVLRALLARPDAIDVLVPRGSPSLIDYCQTASTIPVLASGGGVNHLYVHRSAEPATAASIALDSKVPAPAGCTSLEVVLVDSEMSEPFVDALLDQAERDGSAVTLRVDQSFRERPKQIGSCRFERLGEHDLGREFLDSTIGILSVDGLDAAVAHVGRYGSGHTEGVLTNSPEVATEFCRRVDASAVIVNGSLRLNDGPTLGLGSEIAISTSRLHARGPVTLANLLSHTWVVEANGRLRGDG